MKPVDEQFEWIRRGTEQIEPLPELRKKLECSVATGKPLRVKYGIDPTGIDVHLGHTVPLRKLRLFQELGHQAVLIIGNYTALVGDPSGRDQTRARLTQEQVEKNAEDYLKQIGKIIDLSKTEVRRNGEWFGKFNFLDVLSLTSKMTMQRMLERDDFTKRREAGTPIYLHECLYPLMQGWDSVEIKADVELGGSEQLFSLMVARHLQQDGGQEPQICVTLPILRGLDGKRRMGKSLGNYVGVAESAKEQFGKTMSIPDDLLREWFTLLTDRQPSEFEELVRAEPMQAKKTLGQDVVRFYYGDEVATATRADWEKQFSDRKDPDNIEDAIVPADILIPGTTRAPILKVLVAIGLVKSNGEARNKIAEGAVNFGADKTKVTDIKFELELADQPVVRLGRKIKRIKMN